MFTGIITAVGKITSVAQLETAQGVRVQVSAPDFDFDGVGLGDSIAINGACMTVVSLNQEGGRFAVDVSAESLDKTVGLDREGFAVNLERALRFGQTMDGHLVLGHVDGKGQIVRLEHVAESVRLTVLVPLSLSAYVAYKGSITINGVSLTINDVRDGEEGAEVDINLIPHTWENTQFSVLKEGDAVNLEIDSLARYVGRYIDTLKLA
ncbi:MAG: riboflavin synthase [Alcaligenaceae bacterium]|nr:riboflavin synthase [Alcaligenaceae bacterium]